MLVAIYLTCLPAPRLYGVEVLRVLEPESLRVSVAKSDIFITDTMFDPTTVPVKRCCVLKGGTAGIETFAKDNGYDCIETSMLTSWFKKRVDVDISRHARQSVQEAPTQLSVAGMDNSKFKAMYDGLVTELRKSEAYSRLDPNDAKTYDILLQTVRGTLRKADGVAGELTQVQSRVTKADAALSQLTLLRVTTDEDISVVLSGLTQAVSDCTGVLNKLIRLPEDPELVLFSGVAIQARAALGLASKFSSVTAAKELRAIGSVMREFVSCLACLTDGILDLGTDAVKSAAGAQSASHIAAMSKATAERTVQQSKDLLAQERMTSDGLKQQLGQLNTAYQEQLQRASVAENQLLISGGASVPALQEQLSQLRYEIQSKSDYIARMSEAVDRTASAEDMSHGLAPEVATGIIRQLRTQVASLKLERDRATSELAKAKKAAVRESERSETLTNSARSLSQVALRGSQVSALPLFHYVAKALIIPVFGNGSTGVSSAAVSLSKTLGINSRTVLLDFDLVTTDLEGRFGERINPLVKLDDGVTSSKNSAMGLFIEKGKDFFTSHFTELVVRIDSNKAGVLDYLPGFYAKPDLFMLTQADYTTLLNYLGSRYDYIVVDAGKIGCSEIGDQILHNLCMCGFRSLLVTDTCVEKTRAMKLKLNDVFGTDIRNFASKSVWMLNRASKREDLTRFTAPATSITVPILPEMIGTHESFHITGGAQREFNKVVKALSGT